MSTTDDLKLIREHLAQVGTTVAVGDALERLENAVSVLKQVAKDAIAQLPTEGVEYGWAGDAQATTFYDTLEEAEEYMGEPKQFVRMKAGKWKEVQ